MNCESVGSGFEPTTIAVNSRRMGSIAGSHPGSLALVDDDDTKALALLRRYYGSPRRPTEGRLPAWPNHPTPRIRPTNHTTMAASGPN